MHDAMQHTLRDGLTWLRRLRLKVLTVLLAGALAAIGLVSWAALPAIPVVGVTIFTVAAVLNSLTTRLGQPTCWSCGHSLADAKAGVHGAMCDACGSINQHKA